MPIFTHSYIAAAVIEARAIDQRDDTDLAAQRVADLTHLTAEGVAEIAREEAHAEALAMPFSPLRMPEPDDMGFFCHPDVPGEEESDDVRALLAAMGYDVAGVSMEWDADEHVQAAREAEDLTAPTRWTPTPPAGDGWQLVAKFNTEDGPHAWFVRPLSKLAAISREIAAVSARVMGITLEVADAPACRGCGACNCNRQTAEA